MSAGVPIGMAVMNQTDGARHAKSPICRMDRHRHLQVAQVGEDTLYWIKRKIELRVQCMIVEISSQDDMFRVEYEKLPLQKRVPPICSLSSVQLSMLDIELSQTIHKECSHIRSESLLQR